jgi:hypothetical protein
LLHSRCKRVVIVKILIQKEKAFSVQVLILMRSNNIYSNYVWGGSGALMYNGV